MVMPSQAHATFEVASAPAGMGLLNELRFVAMNCRTKPQTNLFEACALLQTNRDRSRQAHAEALMRCLNEALGQNARLHAPGVSELTFDDAWLLRLGTAAADQDDASLSFLLRSRVSLEHQRLVRFLIQRIADSFAQI